MKFKCRLKVTLLLTSPTYQGVLARSAGSKLGNTRTNTRMGVEKQPLTMYVVETVFKTVKRFVEYVLVITYVI